MEGPVLYEHMGSNCPSRVGANHISLTKTKLPKPRRAGDRLLCDFRPASPAMRRDWQIIS